MFGRWSIPTKFYREKQMNLGRITSPIVGRNRTKPCGFSDIRTLFLNNLICVRNATADRHTLLLCNIMYDCRVAAKLAMLVCNFAQKLRRIRVLPEF